MHYCGVVATQSSLQLAMLEEVRTPEPPIRLSALFYEPGSAADVARELHTLSDVVIGVGAPLAGPRNGRPGRDCDALREIGVDVTPPKGTIYVWAPVPEGHTSASYCEMVLEESGVVISPGSAYGPNGEGFFRISLTIADERLTEAVERLRGSLSR